MLGAMIGDVIGSPYEFDDVSIKTTDFPLFSDDSTWTDDTIMTAAVAQAMMRRPKTDEAGETFVIESMQRWGRAIPLVKGGYGARFTRWLISSNPQPYGSYGNGSAMRVSSVGWLYDTLCATEHWAEVTARVTHNHPEGIKGAQATAAAIFMARTGESKDVIRAYVTDRFDYDLTRTIDEIRPDYHHFESCQQTVPEAITAYLQSSDYESAVRLAVSLGGDADTLGAITGAIAEAAYGIPDDIRGEGIRHLNEPTRVVLRQFAAAIAARQ